MALKNVNVGRDFDYLVALSNWKKLGPKALELTTDDFCLLITGRRNLRFLPRPASSLHS